MGRENRFRLLTRINQAFCPGRGRENWKMGRENSFRLMSWINQAFCTGRGRENRENGQREQFSVTDQDISGILYRSWRKKTGMMGRENRFRLLSWIYQAFCPGRGRENWQDGQREQFSATVLDKSGILSRSWQRKLENGQRKQVSATVLDISGILSRSWQRKLARWAKRTVFG